MKTGKSTPRRRSRGLTEHSCPTCGSLTVLSSAKLTHPVNGEPISVSGVPHWRCQKCGEILFELQAATQLRDRANALYRRDHDLLDPEQIRDLRVGLHLSQAQLARLLRLGPNTISRWESGKFVQTAAMDTLLRLLRDVPEAKGHLEKHAA